MNEPVFIDAGRCPHCSASPTVRRADDLQPICLACMLGSCEVFDEALASSRLAEVFRDGVPREIYLLQEASDEVFRTTWWETTQRAAMMPISEAVLVERGDPVRAALELDALVRGVAALAFSPGGVRLFGMHWTARRPPQARVARGRGRAR